MILAKVTGHVVATQKCDRLRGSNLLLITALDDAQTLVRDKTWVAVDCVGAGLNDVVLAEPRFAQNESLFRPMSIVAIVEKVFREYQGGES